MPRLVEPDHDPRPAANGRTRGWLVDGVWTERTMSASGAVDADGNFRRPEQPFRSWLSKPGEVRSRSRLGLR